MYQISVAMDYNVINFSCAVANVATLVSCFTYHVTAQISVEIHYNVANVVM